MLFRLSGWDGRTYLPSHKVVVHLRSGALMSLWGGHDNTIAYSNQGYIAADMNNDGLDDLIEYFPISIIPITPTLKIINVARPTLLS